MVSGLRRDDGGITPKMPSRSNADRGAAGNPGSAGPAPWRVALSTAIPVQLGADIAGHIGLSLGGTSVLADGVASGIDGQCAFGAMTYVVSGIIVLSVGPYGGTLASALFDAHFATLNLLSALNVIHMRGESPSQ